MMSMSNQSRHLFLALSIPEDLYADDPDDVADAIADMLNQARLTKEWARQVLDGTYDSENPTANVKRIMVNGIPAPQWLTAATLSNLRRAAAGEAE